MNKVIFPLVISIWAFSGAVFGQQVTKNDMAAVATQINRAFIEIINFETLSWDTQNKIDDALSTCNMKVKWRIREYHIVNGNIERLNSIQNKTLRRLFADPGTKNSFREAKSHVEGYRNQIAALFNSGCVEGNLDYWQNYEKEFARVRDPSMQRSFYLISDLSLK